MTGFEGISPAGNETGMRQLIVCCDGTNNTLTGGVADTNVLQFHQHLVRHPAPPGVERILFYDPGVGSPDAVPPTDPMDWVKRSWERTSGLASGRGIYDNIAEAYRFLMRHWRGEQDQIYCFGFSRGAFTARCVVGMVHLFGILEPQHEAMVPTLIRIYFSLPSGQGRWWQRATRWLHQSTARKGVAGRAVPEQGRELLARQVRYYFATPQGREAWVHWVGVWDTVESVGLPGPLSRSNPSTATFLDKRVCNVRHALAFDEHRWTFLPRLYEVPGDVSTFEFNRARTLKQRWFPGVHCDVGGSYAPEASGLSLIAFHWMVNEVAAELLIPPLPAIEEDAPVPLLHDALYETPWWALAGMCLRDMRPRTFMHSKAASAEAGGHRKPIQIIPFQRPPGLASVWDRRRALWPLGLAGVSGLLFLFASGICLLAEAQRTGGWAHTFWNALCEPSRFAWAQLGVLFAGGLPVQRQLPWQAHGQPAWALFWDFAFIGAYGYLIARCASRAFTWMAGLRAPGQARPFWHVLGMAPLLAVGADAAENIATLSAMAVHGLGVDWLAFALLYVAAICALAKFAGLVACTPFLVVRLVMVVAGRSRIGAVNRA